jgi:hypothetical protein
VWERQWRLLPFGLEGVRTGLDKVVVMGRGAPSVGCIEWVVYKRGAGTLVLGWEVLPDVGVGVCRCHCHVLFVGPVEVERMLVVVLELLERLRLRLVPTYMACDRHKMEEEVMARGGLLLRGLPRREQQPRGREPHCYLASFPIEAVPAQVRLNWRHPQGVGSWWGRGLRRHCE